MHLHKKTAQKRPVNTTHHDINNLLINYTYSRIAVKNCCQMEVGPLRKSCMTLFLNLSKPLTQHGEGLFIILPIFEASV